MKYCVNVPLERELVFPNRCPFSDRPSPTGTIRLKRSSTSAVLPIPGGFVNSHSKTTLSMPAERRIVALATALEILMWLSILGGMIVAVLLSMSETHTRFAALYVPVGLLVALGFRIARWVLLKRVQIGNAWNGFIEVRFGSESYAKEFSELNRLSLA